MAKDRIHELIVKFFNGTCSSDEKEELALWIDTFRNEEEWLERLQEVWAEYEPEEEMEEKRAEQILEKIVHGQEKEVTSPPKIVPLRKKILRWSVAAAIVVLVIGAVFFFVSQRKISSNTIAVKATETEITPGGNRATLTLAGGKTIFLDSISNGLLANNGNAKVIKVSNGVLKLQKEGNEQGDIRRYNTITTPRGGQYKVVLPDGSQVWLNAASSLKFPTVFGENKRTISIKGEVFAKIAKDENRPFYVQILSDANEDKGTVKVLGTTFNINAYSENKHVKATLLSGSIKIEKGKAHNILVPGERAFVQDGKIEVQKESDLDRIVAWKDGKFNFEGYDIRHVMQQIARWYDVNVKYENMPTDHFVGTISRGSDISEVLGMLEMTGVVHFEIEGKTVLVSGEQ